MKNSYRGFTLIETLLVLVIISIIIYSGIGYMQQRTLQMRIDRTSVQMQQILNASLSYYVLNNKWPTSLSDLQGQFLPPNTVTLKNPWGKDYVIDGSNVEMLHVFTSTESAASTQASAAANVIAGTLPLSYATPTAPAGTVAPAPAAGGCTNQTTCYIVASVNIPGQNLNNARAINFAGLYKHGACVPVPKCPVDTSGITMTPQVFVAPVQVAGTFEGGLASSTPNVYPLSSFGAYATAKANSPAGCTNSAGVADGGVVDDCAAITVPGGGTLEYWRVCMRVVTERGEIPTTATNWGDNQTIMALTRCVTDSEPAGSTFNIYP